jgi:glycerol-3-phosphate acyltransferase PlsY
MVLGPRLGCTIAVLDMLKVAFPMLAFKLAYPDHPYFLILAVAGLVGHIWPVYHRFRGGRGLSVILGSLAVIDWLGALVVPTVGMVLGMTMVRSLSVAYLGWLWLIIPWLWLRTHDFAFVAYAIAINFLFLVGTVPEIRTMIMYRREGKLDAYMEGLKESSPRWRGMSRIADWLRFPKKGERE